MYARPEDDARNIQTFQKTYSKMYIMKSEQEPGVAVLTISVAQDDHTFEIWADGDTAFVEYQESLTWRGIIRVSEPGADIYKELMVSDEVTEFLDEYDLDRVQRADTPE